MKIKHLLCLLILTQLVQFSLAQSFKKDNEVYRKKLNKEFKDPQKSPLTQKDLSEFKALKFFPLNEIFKVKAVLTVNASPQLFKMPTSTDNLPVYSTYGELTFELSGQQYTLQVYQNQQLKNIEGFEDYLFVPFSDQTNGDETYGGGRYLDFRIPKSKEITIDFNKAYNPYCAYNDHYSCPKVPESNNLVIRIEAGALNWEH